MTVSPHRATILELAARPEGVRSCQVMEACKVNLRSAKKFLYRMAEAGTLHKLPGRTKSHWYFATPELAAAWKPPKKVRKPRIVPPDQRKPIGRPPGTVERKPRNRSASLHDARVNAVSPHWRSFEPVYEPSITAETKVTICPSQPDRFHVTHAPRVVDPRECRQWAALLAA